MKRFIALLCMVVGLGMASMPPALADHDQDYYVDNGLYSGERWNETITENFCTEGFGPLSGSEKANVDDTVESIVNVEFEVGTDISTNWNYTGSCDHQEDHENFFDGGEGGLAGDCIQIAQNFTGGLQSRIDLGDLPGDTLGETRKCDLDDNGMIDFFWIVVNDCQYRAPFCTGSNALNWHWGHDPGHYGAIGDVDFPGIFAHEFGHATGFDLHFPGSSGACPDNSGSNTMCPGGDWNPAVVVTNTICGCAWRTLQSDHEIPEINQAYP